MWAIDTVPTIIRSIHGNIAKGAILRGDLQLRPIYVAKCNGCFAHGESIAAALRDAEAKALQCEPIEARIERFVKCFPTLDTQVEGEILFAWHHILTGSCRAGREEFIRQQGLRLEETYSVGRFIELTNSAYGGEIVKQLETAYHAKL